MSAYLVIEVKTSDWTKFGQYERQALPLAVKFGGEPVARDANPLLIERDDKPGLGVILKFPDRQAVQDYFDSAEYSPLRTFRQSFATARALVIEA